MEQKNSSFYNNILQIISNKSLKSQNVVDFCKNLHNLAQEKLCLPINDLCFEKLNKKIFGHINNDRVVINEKLTTPKYISQLSYTIFNQNRQLYQKYNLVKKDININHTPQLPIVYCNKNIFLISNQKKLPNPDLLYTTSQNQKDASSYANIETYSLLQKLKQYNSNKKINKLLTMQLDNLKSNISQNDQAYKSNLNQLNIFKKSYQQNIKDFALECLSKATDIDKMSNLTDAIFQIYSDTQITQKYFEYAINNSCTPMLFSVLNSPYSKIDRNMLNEFFDYCKKQNISYSDIIKNLYFWKAESLENSYNLLNNPDKNDEIKMAKIKLYKSLENTKN